jgi:phosphatidylserine/phosphatidylglycerophosphate/cardiolipin synthase-like enzyme
MAALISIKDDLLLVDIQGADKLWVLKSRLEIPLAHVASAAPAEAEAREWLHGIRLGGTHIPGVISAGRFYSHGKWVLWDVHDPAKAIGIALRDEHYTNLVVEVHHPEEKIKQIREAVRAFG